MSLGLALSQFATLLISPLGTSLLLTILGIKLAWPVKNSDVKKKSLFLLSFSVLWLFIWSAPKIQFTLVSFLEKDFPPVQLSYLPEVDAIVALGGAIAPPMPPKFPYPNLNNRGDRIWQAARLYRAGKAPVIVLSGAFDPEESSLSEAEAMAIFLEDLGVPNSALLIEGESLSTAENAYYVSKLLNQRELDSVTDKVNPKTILLVTSAIHMYRAKKIFEKEGFRVIPAPIDHEAVFEPKGLKAWIPEADALAGSAKAIKEAVGRIIY